MLRLFFPSIEEINGPKVQLMCPAREKNNGLASEVVLLVGFINRGRNGVGVPDPVRKETTHERERNQEHRPPHPVRRILGRRASGSVPADENRLEPGSKVDQAVDDPDGRARVLRPCEVSGRSAGEDSVHTNDAEGNDEDGATREPQVPGQSTAHEHERNEHEDVEDDSHGSPPRSEEPIRDPARGKGAGNTADEQSKTPVVADPEVLGEPNLFRELGVPLHDPIPKEAARELHDADHLQDRMREDLPEHGLDRFTLTTRREHGLTSLEVLEASFSRGVAQPGEHQDPEDREKDGRDEEDGPVLVVSARAESEHRLEDRCPEAKVFLRSRATRVHDGESPVKGKENACGDEDAEDGGERAPLTHMEPGRLHGHNRNCAEALEVHVESKEDGEGRDDRHVPAESGVAVQDESHREIHDERAHDTDQHGSTSTNLVSERAVHEERQRVDPGSDREDRAELSLGHELVAERALGDVEVVSPHVQERIRDPHGEPIPHPTPAKCRRVRVIHCYPSVSSLC